MYSMLNETQIHPSVRFGSNVRLGFGVILEEGCEVGDNTIIANYCVLRQRSKVGKNCKIGHFVVFEGDCSVGNDVVIQPFSIITRNAIVEDKVFLGPHFVGLNDRDMCHLRKPFVPSAPIIRYAARVGGKVTVMPGVEIGDNAVVGSGALVTKDVPGCEIWYGLPAKFERFVPDEEIIT